MGIELECSALYMLPRVEDGDRVGVFCAVQVIKS